MELTPEDRQRIYEEEKARIEAQAQLREEEQRRTLEQAGKQAGNCFIGCIAVFAVVAVLVLLGVMLSGDRGDDSNGGSSSSATTHIGPHDGKTQEQVDKDQEDIQTMKEAAKQIESGK